MKFHDLGASWFLTQVKANCAKNVEMNIDCERFQTRAPGSSWRLWADKSGVWLVQVNSGPYSARVD